MLNPCIINIQYNHLLEYLRRWPMFSNLQWNPTLRKWQENPSNTHQSIPIPAQPLTNQQKASEMDAQLFKNERPSKRIKRALSASNKEGNIAGYIDKTVKKKSFQPTIISRSPKIINRRMRFQRFKQNNPLFFKGLMQGQPPTREYHSSTEEETPSVILEDHKFDHRIRFQKREENRVYHSIWKGNINVPALVRVGEIRMNDFIAVPMAEPNSKVVKLKDGKKVFLGGRCNSLTYNDSGELVQVETIEETKSIPSDLIKYLENLALEMTEPRRIRVDCLKEEAQWLKDKHDIESQTCKNQDLDELDEVESRQC